MSLNAQYSAGRSGSNILIVPALKGRNVQFCLPRSSCTFCLWPLRSAFVSDLVLVCSSHSAVWWSLAIASHPYTWMMYKYRKILFSSLSAKAVSAPLQRSCLPSPDATGAHSWFCIFSLWDALSDPAVKVFHAHELTSASSLYYFIRFVFPSHAFLEKSGMVLSE